MREEKSYCRLCAAFCGTIVTIEGDRILRVRGDRDDPLSRGYACFKGLQAADQHHGPGRLLRPLMRKGGQLVEGSSEAMLADAGARLKAIVAAHGPAAVGLYKGTQCSYNSASAAMADAFVAALGTPRSFITMTIDQSAKWIAEQRLGAWAGGVQDFESADVWLFIGTNPLVTMVGAGGPGFFLMPDPVKALKARKARGQKLIVIDPRRSETARFADLFVQPLPGRDAELLAAIIHVVLREGWHDAAFCAQYVDGLEALRTAVAPFAPHACAALIGITPDEIEAIAAMFARDAASGMAGAATGTNMARHSNLAEHLVHALNVICGRFPRAGEPVRQTGALRPPKPLLAGVRKPATREWDVGFKTLTHALGRIWGTAMTAEIPNEILHPSEQRMRALICIGGNLATALPDQAHAEQALSALELLIVIDPRLTATARLATHVFAPRIMYERPDHSASIEAIAPRPFAHYTPALVPAPEGSDLVDDWYPLWSLARSLGLSLTYAGQPLAMDNPPTAERLFAAQTAAGPISFEEVKHHQGGQAFPPRPLTIEPLADSARFDLVPADVAKECATLAREWGGPPAPEGANLVQLIVRRHRETNNSTGADFASTWQRLPGNPAYFHPDDLARLGLAEGDMIELERGAACIAARAASDVDLRPGLASVGHCRPGLRERPWEATNALVDADANVQAINRMPIMTGLWVRVRKLEMETLAQPRQDPAQSPQ